MLRMQCNNDDEIKLATGSASKMRAVFLCAVLDDRLGSADRAGTGDAVGENRKRAKQGSCSKPSRLARETLAPMMRFFERRKAAYQAFVEKQAGRSGSSRADDEAFQKKKSCVPGFCR